MAVYGSDRQKRKIYPSVQIQISTAIVSKGCGSNLSDYISSFRRLYIDFYIRRVQVCFKMRNSLGNKNKRRRVKT